MKILLMFSPGILSIVDINDLVGKHRASGSWKKCSSVPSFLRDLMHEFRYADETGDLPALRRDRAKAVSASCS